MVDDEFTDVPPGKIATIVTHLEMTEPAPLRPEQPSGGLTLRAVETPEVAWYQALFTRVGAHDWLWFSRLELSDDDLAGIIQHRDVEVYALAQGGVDEGLLELDFRVAGACELAFFGVSPALIGTGAGRYLMNRAIACAWRRPIDRFHVHTCTLDHPAAVGFYMRSGFRPVRQQVQIADDPRLTGLLPDTAAPHVPIFR